MAVVALKVGDGGAGAHRILGRGRRSFLCDNKREVGRLGEPLELEHLSTTGRGFFAECLRHSAKADIHSAKPLPSVTLGKGRSVNSLSAKTSLLSALYRALGKAFAEC